MMAPPLPPSLRASCVPRRLAFSPALLRLKDCDSRCVFLIHASFPTLLFLPLHIFPLLWFERDISSKLFFPFLVVDEVRDFQFISVQASVLPQVSKLLPPAPFPKEASITLSSLLSFWENRIPLSSSSGGISDPPLVRLSHL